MSSISKFKNSFVPLIVFLLLTIFLLFGFNRIMIRMTNITQEFNETYQLIYESGHYENLPDEAKNSLEIVKNQLYFSIKVNRYYFFILSIIVGFLFVLVVASLLLKILNTNKTS